MTKKRVLNIILAAIFYMGFAVFTVAVQEIDVQPIGPQGSLVGFAGFNQQCFESFGQSAVWYELTQIIGWIAVLICALFGVIGVMQLIKGKSLRKVDPDLICMGIFYILCIICYVIFLKVTVNCRPVLEDGVLESSYPSSHTMLGICVFASLIIEVSRRINNRGKALIEEIACLAMICIAVLGRLLSGMHWATDIIGGIIISLAMIFTFLAILPDRKKRSAVKDDMPEGCINKD